ncbi:MAG TPA: FliH/SctL family protein [Telmatospirillum sp.]|nr:FliH/SctL family protein [Telmatospirillum sp.]
MAKLQKYLFDLDFDAPPPRPVMEVMEGAEFDIPADEMEEELPPPPPTFSEEELAFARQQAMEAGRQAGIQEAVASTERLLALSAEAIAANLQNIAIAQQQANDDRMRDAVSVALTVVRKLQPEMSRDHALEEIAGVVRECLAHIEKDVRVTIRVNPAHIDSIRHFANQAAEATGFEGKLVYTADPRIVTGDCRVEWGDGGAERDQARLWTEIDAVIARAMGEMPYGPTTEESEGQSEPMESV